MRWNGNSARRRVLELWLMINAFCMDQGHKFSAEFRVIGWNQVALESVGMSSASLITYISRAIYAITRLSDDEL